MKPTRPTDWEMFDGPVLALSSILDYVPTKDFARLAGQLTGVLATLKTSIGLARVRAAHEATDEDMFGPVEKQPPEDVVRAAMAEAPQAPGLLDSVSQSPMERMRAARDLTAKVKALSAAKGLERLRLAKEVRELLGVKPAQPAPAWNPKEAAKTMSKSDFVNASVAHYRAKKEAQGVDPFPQKNYGDRSEFKFRQAASMAWDENSQPAPTAPKGGGQTAPPLAPLQMEKRNIWIPNMTPKKLERLLSKTDRTADDIEDLRDFKYFLLTDQQSAVEKGFMTGYTADGGPVYVLKNKFWLTNIEAAISGENPVAAPADLSTNPPKVDTSAAPVQEAAKSERVADKPLPPKLSAQLLEAHRALGRDVTRSQVQRMRDLVAREVETGTTNNGGVTGKLNAKGMADRRAQLQRLDADLALFVQAADPALDPERIRKMAAGAAKQNAIDAKNRAEYEVGAVERDAERLAIGQPEWTKLEGVDVLRIKNSKFVAVPNSGRKNAARFDIIDITARDLVAQVLSSEVKSWLLRAAKAEQDNGQAPKPAAPAQPQAEPVLTAPTRADIEAQQARAEQAARDKAKADRDAEAREVKARELADIKRRSEAAAASFVLGGDALANLSGQRGVFDRVRRRGAEDRARSIEG